MKTMLKKAALAASLVALTVVPAAAQVGVYFGPFGGGVYHRPHYYGHRVCRMDYYGYEHCWWVRDWDRD